VAELAAVEKIGISYEFWFNSSFFFNRSVAGSNPASGVEWVGNIRFIHKFRDFHIRNTQVSGAPKALSAPFLPQ
jgi:hypothetical protein